MISKQEDVSDWTFAWQELRREQGVDMISVMSDARFVSCRLDCLESACDVV